MWGLREESSSVFYCISFPTLFFFLLPHVYVTFSIKKLN